MIRRILCLRRRGRSVRGAGGGRRGEGGLLAVGRARGRVARRRRGRREEGLLPESRLSGKPEVRELRVRTAGAAAADVPAGVAGVARGRRVGGIAAAAAAAERVGRQGVVARLLDNVHGVLELWFRGKPKEAKKRTG